MIGVKPAGLEIVNLKDYLPEYPERKEVKYTFTSVASFCQYVNEQKNEYSRIFAKLRESPYVFDAVIDHHQMQTGAGIMPYWNSVFPSSSRHGRRLTAK